MKLCILALASVSVLIFTSACNRQANEIAKNVPVASPKASSTPDEFATARATFKKNCAVCHGDDGTGGKKTVEGKTLKVPNFREGHALHHPDEDFIKQITKGGDGMPK